MASWLALDADDLRPEPQAFAAGAAAPGVAETETVLPQAEPVEPAEPEVDEVKPAVRPMPIVPPPPARPRTDPAARTPVTTRSAPAPATVYASLPANPEPEPGTGTRTEPVEPAFVELHVPAGAVLGVRLNTGLTSDTAEIEDRVEATVTRDVIAGGRVAIPAGTKVLGSVNEVTRGGKFKERARLGIRFHTLVLADGTREAVRVDPIVREGDSPTRASAARIGGGAVGGAIIGGILGGKKGAILGGAAGAGAGTAAAAAGDRSVAALTAGSPLSIRLDAPVNITIERNPQ
ncbi:MAG TPA: TrbI/VirB10 family protein [Vicinamibacterales bacterium]|nr:TrbI/VirB10 family protein [Vicinamibacterales bacterium]